MNAVTTKFVRTSTNKVKCPVFVIRVRVCTVCVCVCVRALQMSELSICVLQWTPEGRRLVTGASSGEFTLWNGLTFNFETILQVHTHLSVPALTQAEMASGDQGSSRRCHGDQIEVSSAMNLSGDRGCGTG